MRKILYNPDTDNLILETIEYFISSIKAVEDDKVFMALTYSEDLEEFYNNFKSLAKFMEMRYWNKLVLFLTAENKEQNKPNQEKMHEILFENLLSRKIVSKDQILDISNEEDLKKIERVDIVVLNSDKNSKFETIEQINENTTDSLYETNDDKTKISLTPFAIKSAKSSFIFFLNPDNKNAYLKFKNKNLDESECLTKITENCENNYIISNISTAKELIRVKKLEDINI